MFDKFARSWDLIKASASVLQKDRELLVFPAVSSVAAVLVAISFILPGVMMFMGQGDSVQGGDVPIGFWVWLFAFYLVQYFVIFFFNTALIGAASIRLEGGDPTVADGFRIAWARVGQILGYAVIAATVGLILRAIEERAGWLGKIVVGLIGVAWTMASFMVVPVLVHKNVGPMQAVKESAELLKKTWGENVIGQGGVGIVFGLGYVVLWVVFGGLAVVGFSSGSAALGFTLVATGVILTIFMGLIQAALQGIYSAALYRYATGHVIAEGFSTPLLEHAFATKAK